MEDRNERNIKTGWWKKQKKEGRNERTLKGKAGRKEERNNEILKKGRWKKIKGFEGRNCNLKNQRKNKKENA